MLNGEDNENGFKTNRSNQQKNKLHVQHTFSSNQQKTDLHVQHAFSCSPRRFFARLQRRFVRLKRQTSQLHIIFMEELSYVLTQSIPVFMFVTAGHFHLAGCQHFSFSHRGFQFLCFSSYKNSSPLFSITRSSSFSVIHFGVNKK